MEEYLGVPFPYESYKQVFVEDAYTRIDSRASIATLSTHFLHGEDIIDQVLYLIYCFWKHHLTDDRR